MGTQNNVSANIEMPLQIKTLSVKDVRTLLGGCDKTARVRRKRVADSLGKPSNMVTRKDMLEYYKLR